ncbi:hypothetical protein D1872_286300 [compost metagenome]
MILHNNFCHGCAETAVNAMFLNGNDASSFTCSGNDRLFIQRLDCMHVDYPGGYAFVVECLGGIECDSHGFTDTNNCNVVAFSHSYSFAYFEWVIIGFVNVLNGITPDSHVYAAVIFYKCFSQFLRFVTISRQDNRQSRNCPGYCDILHGVV